MKKICTICKEEKDTKDFTPYYGEKRKEGLTRNVCRRCSSKKNISNIKNNPERLKKSRLYMSEYYKRHNEVSKVKAYRNFDKKRNFDSVTLDEFRLIRGEGRCFYCGEANFNELGLDRIDNNKGHNKENVVLCCEKCNNILSDLPFEAKEILKEGLTKIKNKDLLNSWTIPTKRKKKA